MNNSFFCSVDEKFVQADSFIPIADQLVSANLGVTRCNILIS
jgi:hypothetical protein